MKSNGKRMIRSGEEFDHLIPKATGKDHRVKGYADVEDTLKLIKKTVPKTLWQTKAIAKVLRGKTLEDTCSNIWHFIYNHVQYKKDKDGVEQIRSPRRTWRERFSGVDCDCYTEFISSILSNLGIPHVLRITKYPQKPPDIPRWQHIYPIVPVTGRLDGTLSGRREYIVMDCVKDDFNDEQPFLEHKDYDMRLDYLDGIEGDDASYEESENPLEMLLRESREPENVDIADIESVYDTEEMGSLFKKIGNAVKKVADVQKKIVKKTIDINKAIVKKTIVAPTKKIVEVAKKGVHFINRFTNPGTILLRNGFLLAVKVNLFNIGGRLRYAYLSDEEARKRDMNPEALAKVRKIKDKAEKIYYDAGGMKANFKKAVLKGRGNKKHNPVPLNGLGGFDEDIYADEQEYAVLYGLDGDLNGLGEIAAGASIAAAMAAVGAVAGALKQVKGLFNKGGSEEKSFQSETDNAATVDEAKSGNIPDSEDEVRTDDDAPDASSIDADSDPTLWLTEAANTVSRVASEAKPLVQAARASTPSIPLAPVPSITKPQIENNNETTTQAKRYCQQFCDCSNSSTKYTYRLRREYN
ncbi:hypothetical protein ACFQ21_05220 [Ohtaekwangia kribbensis]|jgi:hypothetical protein|uniref:Transglutaminase-like domain-containing protein n=1 Tax=Ohtaekwangia kribbensis TaxID=688913 RepID=A0ABW3JYT5_9BACT